MSGIEAVDLVVFDVGGTRYAADLGQVRRVDVADFAESVGQPLGRPLRGGRSLVFAVSEGERRLTVDQVHGVSRVPLQHLRRMPTAVNAPKYSIGAWLDGEATVLLIDLLSTVPQDPTEAPHGH
jgi:chemotaxis signal transduction protein